MTNVVVQIGSGSYSGWESVTVERSAEQVAGTFSLDVTNKTTSLYSSAMSIRPGGACTILADGQLVLTGWVEKVHNALTAQEHSITITGGSKTVDVIDSSVVHPSGQFKQKNAMQIAQELTSDMGINVRSEIPLTPIPNYRTEDGETILEAIMRIAHRDGALVTDDEQGNLVFSEGGKAGHQGTITEGVHFESGESDIDYEQIFSEYRVKGQSSLVDENWARGAVDLLGIASSAKAPGRTRRLIIHDHTDTDRATVRKRALWEAQRRSGKVTSASLTIPSWMSPAGSVWKPNSTIYLVAPSLGIQQTMMIVSASMTVDNAGGSEANLSLQPPEAFKAAASATGARDSSGGDINSPNAVAEAPEIASSGTDEIQSVDPSVLPSLRGR